jgi:hypothetical protein
VEGDWAAGVINVLYPICHPFLEVSNRHVLGIMTLETIDKEIK